MVKDIRRTPGGAFGPCTTWKVVNLTGGDFVDERGFIWCNRAGTASFTFRTEGDDVDRTETFEQDKGPAVCLIPVMCTAIRQAPGRVALVGNL